MGEEGQLMDPVTFKFVQLLLAEILGGILCLAGVYLFVRGVTGNSNLLVQGIGLQAKLTNGTPGGIIALIGLAVIFLSLHSSVERVEQSSDKAQVLQSWLERAARVTDKMNYSQMTDLIVGNSPNVRFNSVVIKAESNTTIADLARSQYGDSRFWQLIAAINKDRGYYKLADAKAETPISKGKVVEAWQVSMYNGMDVMTRTKVAGANVAAAYDQLLTRAAGDAPYNASALMSEFEGQEISLAYSPIDMGDAHTLREISFKYFGNAKYWPLVAWMNPGAFPKGASEDTNPHQASKELYILHAIGWPR